MSKIGTSCAIFKDILGMYLEEEKALAIHDVIEMPTHNGFTKAEMLNVIKWLWHQKYRLDDEPMTNADRIRNMTDEELADFLHNIGSYVEDGEPLLDIYIGMDEEITISDDFGNIKEWLQAEVEEGAEHE